MTEPIRVLPIEAVRDYMIKPGVNDGCPLDKFLDRLAAAQPTEPVIADDFAEYYGHLPVMLADTAQLLASYTTGDVRGWDAEEADLDLSETIASVRQHGVVNPITLGTDGRVLDGHHRLLAAQRLGIGQVPVRLAIMPTEPVRVLPSREEVRALIHQDHMDPCTGWCETQTERVLALFANAHTVEQVKAEAWDEGFVAGWNAQHVAEKAFNPYRAKIKAVENGE